jgi:hypothetical protein
VNVPGEKFCGGCGKSLTASTPVQSAQQGEWSETRFQALLPAVIGQLQGRKRVTYRTLKYIFGLSDALLDEIREELTFKQLARDEHGQGLVWSGETQPIMPSIVDVPSQPSIADTTEVTSPALPTARGVKELRRIEQTLAGCLKNLPFIDMR